MINMFDLYLDSHSTGKLFRECYVPVCVLGSCLHFIIHMTTRNHCRCAYVYCVGELPPLKYPTTL